MRPPRLHLSVLAFICLVGSVQAGRKPSVEPLPSETLFCLWTTTSRYALEQYSDTYFIQEGQRRQRIASAKEKEERIEAFLSLVNFRLENRQFDEALSVLTELFDNYRPLHYNGHREKWLPPEFGLTTTRTTEMRAVADTERPDSATGKVPRWELAVRGPLGAELIQLSKDRKLGAVMERWGLFRMRLWIPVLENPITVIRLYDGRLRVTVNGSLTEITAQEEPRLLDLAHALYLPYAVEPLSEPLDFSFLHLLEDLSPVDGRMTPGALAAHLIQQGGGHLDMNDLQRRYWQLPPLREQTPAFRRLVNGLQVARQENIRLPLPPSDSGERFAEALFDRLTTAGYEFRESKQVWEKP